MGNKQQRVRTLRTRLQPTRLHDLEPIRQLPNDTPILLIDQYNLPRGNPTMTPPDIPLPGFKIRRIIRRQRLPRGLSRLGRDALPLHTPTPPILFPPLLLRLPLPRRGGG